MIETCFKLLIILQEKEHNHHCLKSYPKCPKTYFLIFKQTISRNPGDYSWKVWAPRAFQVTMNCMHLVKETKSKTSKHKKNIHFNLNFPQI